MTHKYYIKSISIEGFRGINNQGNPLIINFQSDGVTSLFGENGKGKSSIFEAIIFSILGRIVRFDNYHGDIKDKKTIKNIFHSGSGNIKIDFIDSDSSIVKIDIDIDSNGVRTFNACSITDPEKFLESLASDLNFLDYNSFEKIMLQSSEDTGKLFSNLVGFGNFIHIKEKFDKISRTQNINTDFGKTTKESSLRDNNKRISDIKSEIIRRINEIGISTTNYDENKLLNDVKSFLKEQYSLKPKKIDTSIDFDKLIKLKIGEKYEENVEELNRQQEMLSHLLLLQSELKKFTPQVILTLRRKLNSAHNHLSSSDDLILGKLFDIAIQSYVVTETEKNTCVLCDTKELGNIRNTFYDQLTHKVENYKKFKEKYSLFLNEFYQQANSFKVLDFENKFLVEEDKFFSMMLKKEDFFEKDFFDENNIQEITLRYKNILSTEIGKIKNKIKELKTLIPPRVSELVETNNVYKFIVQSIFEINKLAIENVYYTKYLAELENWIRFINEIKEDYEKSYNVLMDEIASMIDSDTKLFFKEIMGNIDITPKLKKENKGQRVNILLEKFHSNSTDIKAASILSESNRNALSLSIYFAAALKSKNSGNFIIVDDITSSFDSGHQIFLLNLLRDKISISSNKNGKQLIFLTHDGVLRKTLNENGSNLKKWTHYILHTYNNVTSLKERTSNEESLQLIDNINNNRYQTSEIRSYYEFVLLEIIEKLNLEIPYSLIYNNNNKTVDNLLVAIKEIINLKIKSNKIQQKHFPNEADFKSYFGQFGNILSHKATSILSSYSTSALLKVVDDINDFKRRFQYECKCSKNAGWVYYTGLKKTITHKGCTCKI